jgi:hypothetical protein
MKPSSLDLLLVGGTAMISYATANLALAQPIPQPPAAPITAPPPGAGAPFYDLQQLPAIKGIVSRYTLTPRGDVDGLILTDGTEVHFPPHLSTALVYAVKPGDTVTVRGHKALSVPVVAAVSITNDASGQSIMENGPGFGAAPKPPPQLGQMMSVQARVQTALHGPQGEINGAILDDGTILRLPPPEAERFASLRVPGQVIAAQGNGLITPMGRVVEAQAIGPSSARLSWVQAPGPPPGPRWPRP